MDWTEPPERLALAYIRSSILTSLAFGALGVTAACADAPIGANDVIIRRAQIDEVFVEIISVEPSRIEVTVTGSFRDSCSDIGEITQSRAENTFRIEISTERPMDAICAQVLVPFEELIVLDIENDELPPGRYVVDVNGSREEFVVSDAVASGLHDRDSG